MARLKFLLPLSLLVFLIWFLNTRQPFGLPFPPLGPLLSPFTGFWQQAEPADPVADKNLTLEGLDGEVRVLFDDRLVPHIYADKLEDAFFAQGYVTAAFRLWQMDISIRAAGGRLSEILGEGLLQRDRLQRRKGMMRAARVSVKAWESAPREMAAVQAYSAGINAYLDGLRPADRPVEYKLLDYAPETWTPLHSALMLKSMAETLCFREDDLELSNLRSLLGPEDFSFFFPERNPKQSPVIPEGVEWGFEPLALPPGQTAPSDERLTFRHDPLPQPPPFIGSNNWALAGSRTASGDPLLANDPHLNLTLPSIWYELHIHTPDYQVYGVSLPGLPGVVIGFNADVAWGVTNVGQDVLDWYRIEWTDEQKTRYRVDDSVYTAGIVYDTIQVRGRQEPVVEEQKLTIWGPVVYTDAESPYQDLAMHWLAAQPYPQQDFYELGAFLRLGQAGDHRDYQEALKGYISPAQNFVFASREGDIALQVNGRFPLKSPGQGRFVQEGNTLAHRWSGYIPMEQVPQVKNPERGFVASANQRSTDESYPYYYNGSFDDYRGRYINRTLEKARGWKPEDMMDLQRDARSLFPEELLPRLLERLPREGLSDTARQVLAVLEGWDYRFEAGEAAPVLFEQWYRQAFLLTFDEFAAARDSLTVIFPEKWKLVELLENEPSHPVFDQIETDEREEAAQVIRRAFDATVYGYGGRLMEGDLNWSGYNGLQIRHLGQIDAFSSEPVWSHGYGEAPNAVKPRHGPSWRMVVQLSDPIKAWGVFPGGQSGNPGSRFYDNNITTWAEGSYHELKGPVSADQIESRAIWTFNKP